VVNRKVKTSRGVTRAQIMIALSSPGDKAVGWTRGNQCGRETMKRWARIGRAICVAGAAIATTAAMSACERVNVKKDKIMEDVPRGDGVTSTPQE